VAQKELLASLRRKGEETIAELKAEAERQAAAIEQEFAARMREKKQALASEFRAAREGLARKTVLEAERKKREMHTRAKGELADRFAAIARKLLPALRKDNYELFFARLASEIPATGIERIAVSPKDLELAKRFFPQADVVADAAITGGLRASGENSGLSIDNTFEKRRQRAWQQLLPRLIEEATTETVR